MCFCHVQWETRMAVISKFFAIERDGDLLVMIPQKDMRELDYDDIEADASQVSELVDKGEVKYVVIDFHKTDYFGSTAIGLFVKIWRRLREHDGELALCRLSKHQMDVLKATRLDSVWELCSSREEATVAVKKM